MLINKGYSNGDIVSFKLVNGDEIIARITECNGNGWKVERPCTVVPSQQGIGLMQSMFSADLNTPIELTKEHVMMHAPVISQLESHYIQTTTGIETVPKGSIIK